MDCVQSGKFGTYYSDALSYQVSSDIGTLAAQEFNLAPIKTKRAEVVLDIVDSRTKPYKKCGKVILELRSFLSQRSQKVMAPIMVLDEGNIDPAIKSMRHLQMQFSYSKV